MASIDTMAPRGAVDREREARIVLVLPVRPLQLEHYQGDTYDNAGRGGQHEQARHEPRALAGPEEAAGCEAQDHVGDAHGQNRTNDQAHALLRYWGNPPPSVSAQTADLTC